MPPFTGFTMQCGVCGGTKFTSRRVLWDQLIDDWQISQAEAAYIDRQQGESCDQCGANLRSIALANALRAFLGAKAFLRDAVVSPTGANLALLEINEAGSLTSVLKNLGHYVYGAYPEVDIAIELAVTTRKDAALVRRSAIWALYGL